MASARMNAAPSMVRLRWQRWPLGWAFIERGQRGVIELFALPVPFGIEFAAVCVTCLPAYSQHARPV